MLLSPLIIFLINPISTHSPTLTLKDDVQVVINTLIDKLRTFNRNYIDIKRHRLWLLLTTLLPHHMFLVLPSLQTQLDLDLLAPKALFHALVTTLLVLFPHCNKMLVKYE